MTIKLSENGSANAKVDWVEHLGDQNHLHLLCGDRKLVTLADPMAPFKAGANVELSLKDPLFFDATGERIRG